MTRQEVKKYTELQGVLDKFAYDLENDKLAWLLISISTYIGNPTKPNLDYIRKRLGLLSPEILVDKLEQTIEKEE